MIGVGVFELILILTVVAVAIVPVWVIFAKAGFPGILSLATLVPVLNLIILYYVAFSKWPVHKEREAKTFPYDPIHPS